MSHADRHPRLWRLLAAAMLAALVAVPASPAPRPEKIDLSLERTTDQGLFRISVASAARPIPMNVMHRWTVQVLDRRGRPVSGAALAVDGGMPEHGHGLPTAPRAVAAGQAGQYVIQGMKFSMDGWWQLTLTVNAAGASDKVTFNIML